MLPRTVWTIAHLAIVCVVAWVFFGDGLTLLGNWTGQSWQPGDMGRQSLLMIFSITLWVCMAVIGAVAFYQFGFATFGATTPAPLDGFDVVAVALFLTGSTFNTGSEIQRKRFKEIPANKGRLYTQGLFSLVRHPNYLGDILWALGWALMTRNAWSMLIPAVATAGFVFMFIPQLSAYLAQRYSPQYEDWAKRTKRLFPYIY